MIDLEQQKIVKTVDMPKEEQSANDIDYGRAAIEVSPDGKYLYQFGEQDHDSAGRRFQGASITSIWRSRDFPGMENVHFGGDLDLINEPGEHIADLHLRRSHRSQPACSAWRVSI